MPRITAKHNGTCTACGDPIRKGTPIDYQAAAVKAILGNLEDRRKEPTP